MAQYDWLDIDPDTETGTELADRLDAWVAAIQSQHRGSSAPSYVETAMEWQKTVSGTVEERYVYDGTQSILIYTLNPTAHTLLFPASSLPAASDTVQGAVEFATTTEQLTGTAIARGSTPDSIAALWEKGTDNSNGATITLGEGGSFNLITSTTTITAFVFSTDKAGRKARIRFNTIRSITHNATSLILPNAGGNITTAVGDTCEIESLGSGNFRVNQYTKADGTSLVGTISTFPTGSVIDYAGSSTPTGWVFLNGFTIGSAASGASRANADCQDLFTLLWNSTANAQCPVSSGRGLNAAADWAANKTMTLPDARGRVVAGKDNMGGGSANRLTALSGGVDGDILADGGGLETHTLTTAQMPSHTHPTESSDGSANSTPGGSSVASNVNGVSDPTGGGQAHNNVQPTLILNKIIKL